MHRFMVQALQDPPLCSSTQHTAEHAVCKKPTKPQYSVFLHVVQYLLLFSMYFIQVRHAKGWSFGQQTSHKIEKNIHNTYIHIYSGTNMLARQEWSSNSVLHTSLHPKIRFTITPTLLSKGGQANFFDGPQIANPQIPHSAIANLKISVVCQSANPQICNDKSANRKCANFFSVPVRKSQIRYSVTLHYPYLFIIIAPRMEVNSFMVEVWHSTYKLVPDKIAYHCKIHAFH